MQVPSGLDLDSWINDPPSESSDSEDQDMNEIFVKTDKSDVCSKRDAYEPSVEELQKRREARKLEQENNPHYLKVSSSKNTSSYRNSTNNNEEDFDNIPVAELDIPVSLKITDFRSSKKYFDIDKESSQKRHKKLNKKKKSKKSKFII